MSGVRSMTGFGRSEASLGHGSVVCEVRSVNSRHLDVRVRLPRELAALEAPLRQAASAHFERGQVELAVRLPREGVFDAQVEIDRAAARSYSEAAAELRNELGLRDELSISALLSLPGVSRLREPELEAEAISTCVHQAAESACSSAVEMRRREGESLAEELRGRLSTVEAAVSQIEGRAEEVGRALRERLAKRVAALAPDLEIDPARLEQEALLYADRADVTEETVRMRSHCEQFRETLAGGGSIGRKLEFLLQEMGRETNTIGSKASDTPIARLVVELKTEQEKLREQVLNVE